MVYFFIVLVFLLSVSLSRIIIPRILVVALKKRLFDQPDERKVHTGAIPRLGGISFLPTILFSLSFVTSVRYLCGYEIESGLTRYVVSDFGALICGITLLYMVGLKDDLVGLRYRMKFVIQILVACFFPLAGLWINNLYGLLGIYELPWWLGMPFTVFAVVFITNAINLIDGIDGLASGLSMVALAVFCYLFIEEELWMYAMLASSTIGVLIPFFYYNVFGHTSRGRKIFMGDTGSLSLGYILSFLTLRYVCYNPTMASYRDGAVVIAFSVLIVPIFDVVRVVMLRARMRKPLFSPDKNHIHHKFLAMGLNPRQAMISILFIACSFSCLNIILVQYIPLTILFIADVCIWIGINLWFDRIKKIKNSER